MRDNRKRYHPDPSKYLSYSQRSAEAAREENPQGAVLRGRLEEARRTAINSLLKAENRRREESNREAASWAMLNGEMTLEDILAKSPDAPGYGGGKWAMYSVNCCWWTSFPQDLGALPPVRYNSAARRMEADPGGHRLPCCPHCGSVLMQAPLEKFIESARQHPEHYGPGGLEAFAAAHSRNASFCAKSWSDYEKTNAQ